MALRTDRRQCPNRFLVASLLLEGIEFHLFLIKLPQLQSVKSSTGKRSYTNSTISGNQALWSFHALT